MIQVTPTLTLNDDEVNYDFIRAAGPGGQNVNKVATTVQLRFDLLHSTSLPEAVKQRLAKLAGSRLNQAGVLVIEARRQRTQENNRLEAENKLMELIRKALQNPRKRHATHPTAVSIHRRLEEKKRHGMIKRVRQAPVEKE